MQVYNETTRTFNPEIERVVNIVARRFFRRQKFADYELADVIQSGYATALELRATLEPLETKAACAYLAKSLYYAFLRVYVKFAKGKARKCKYYAKEPEYFDKLSTPDDADATDVSDERKRLSTFLEDEMRRREKKHAFPHKRNKIVRFYLEGCTTSEIALIADTSRNNVGVQLWNFINLARLHAKEAGLV